MWLPLTLLLLAGLVTADYEHGWKAGNEYTYLLRSRTFSSLNQLSDQYTGILIKARLTIQAQDSNRLTAKLSNSQYARIHKSLPGGWNSEISDQLLELRDLPVSGKPFEIKLRHGVIRDIVVDRDVPTWEVNTIKSAASQLQLDSQGENAIRTNEIQVPSDEEPYGSFRAMEDSVGGRCEVLYDITPLPEHVLQAKPELVPLPQLKGDGHFIEITKTKNFDKCEQRMNYHFGISGKTKWEPGTNDNGNFLSKSATSRIVISGNLKRFTIQSSVTTSKMHVSPRFFDQQNGMVASRVNLTLANVNKISNPLPSPSNPESTGNLVYTYNNPFSDLEERRSTKGALDNVYSNQVQASDSISSVSSSEEAQKKGQILRSMSSSSSSSSSSISSSEENEFWQPKPTLEHAPHNPLLPNFIGYKGKYIGRSNEVDVVKASKELVFEIANELEDPSNMPNQETLEKFTILSSLIRTMSRQQISEAENNMHLSPNDLKSNDKSQAIKQNAWSVFRDAVTEAGTGPAFLTIKNWIEKRDIGNLEAAEILSSIPNNARTPTAEYLRAFFELATSPNVENEPILHNSAIMAFGELLRHSQVNSRTIHNRYPVHTFGRPVSKHDQTLKEEYIPYFARELNKAIKEKNSQKIQTFIMALGNIGHPKILSVFEPYLEGKEHVNVFQRTMMVAAFGKLAENFPKLARSVLYKIYLNSMESHEVRCTAVFLLMKTNPPLNMLQRMAEFTNYDTNKHVNSAVKSTLTNLAQLTSPEYQELAKKAQTAAALLTPYDYSYQYSHGYYSDSVNNEKNIISQFIANYIGSDDSFVPRALYLGWYSSYGDFKTPPTELVTMISSVRPFFDMVLNRHRGDQDSVKMAAEKIAEELNIISEEAVPLEGNFMWKSKFLSRFVPFDRHSLRNIPNLISKHALAMKEGAYVNTNKFMSYDVALSFPTESGMPFVYSFRVPILYKISGTFQAQLHQGPEFALKSDMRAVYAQKIQGRIGFVAPFEHHYFLAGVDVNFQTYAPVKFSVEASMPKGRLQFQARPLQGEEKAKLVHYSVVPYTSTHDILSLRPLASEKHTHQVHTDKVESVSLPSSNRIIKADFEGDKSDKQFWNMELQNLEKYLASPWTMDVDKYRKVDLSLNLEREQVEPILLTASYDTKQMQLDPQAFQEWSSEAKAIEPSSKEPDSESRRKQFLSETVRGIKSAKSHVFDVQLQLPSEPKSQCVFTVAWSNSNLENKARTQFYWNLDVPSEQIRYEVCAASQFKASPDYLPYFDQAIQSAPRAEFDVDVRYGKTCSQGERFSVKGRGGQSNEFKEHIKKTRVAKSCEEQMKHGNKILNACRNAVAMAMTLDELEVSMDMHSQKLQSLVNRVMGIVGNSYYLNGRTDTANPKNAGKQKVDIKAKLSKNLQMADVSIYTPTMDVRVNNVDLSTLAIVPEDLRFSGESNTDHTNLAYNEYESSCMLDGTRTETFDGKEYPLRLGNCWHVLMTTYPKVNPEKHDQKLRIPERNSVSILAKETQSGQKEVKILLGNYEIHLRPSSLQPEVTVDGQSVKVSGDMSYQKRQDDNVVFEIYKYGEQSVGLTSQKYGGHLAFDGKRIMITASDKYRNSVRGLCGNFDGDLSNEFMGPKHCFLRKPEQFTASYALTKDQCEGESLQIAKSLQSYECKRREGNRFSNVISETDYNRNAAQRENWGYHKSGQTGEKRCNTHRTQIHETNDKICFTTRPVFACAPGCAATESKSKTYKFHCMERNEAALNLKKRIEKGANPDLSQKSVSMSRPIEVPLACKA